MEQDVQPKTFIFPFRVYVQHTDMGGIVYHAQYLNFAEQARTEFLRQLGIIYATLRQETGGMWVVRECRLQFFKPAVLDDALEVRTTVLDITSTRLSLSQPIYRQGDCLVEMVLQMVWVNTFGKAGRIPKVLFEKIRGQE